MSSGSRGHGLPTRRGQGCFIGISERGWGSWGAGGSCAAQAPDHSAGWAQRLCPRPHRHLGLSVIAVLLPRGLGCLRSLWHQDLGSDVPGSRRSTYENVKLD